MSSDHDEPAGPTPARRFLDALIAHRGRLSAFVAGVTAVAVVISLLLPSWFAAESTILPPLESGDSFTSLTGMIESSALGRLGLMSTSSPSDVYVEILRSRTLAEDLVQAFDLSSVYRRKGVERTVKQLRRHMSVETGPSGVVTVRVEDRDPKRAAAMTDRLVTQLDLFNRESMNTRAKRTRRFLETRLADVEVRLRQADSTLATYERTSGVMIAGETPAVQSLADVMAQRISLQVRRAYMESYSVPGNAGLRAIDAQIAGFDRELGRLPGLKQRGERLLLDAAIQRKVYTLLTAQFEDARVQEMRDTPTLTVLDRARIPEVRVRPRRSVIVLVSALMSAALAAAWAAWVARSAG